MKEPYLPPPLLEKACASIRCRARLEILEHFPSAERMAALQVQIEADPLVQEICGGQQPDGWLGRGFHGYGSIEAGIRVLAEKGLRSDHPVMAGALDALIRGTDRLHLGIGKVGAVLDNLGLGGSEMVRAAVLAYAGVEKTPIVQVQTQTALEGFQAILDIESLQEISTPYQDKLVFKPGVLWPSIYHLRLLALTPGWRTPQNQQMVAEAIGRLLQFSPIPVIHVRHKSQLMAPASFCMQDFNPNQSTLDSYGWMKWFHRMEMLARLGVVASNPGFKNQLVLLKALLAEGDGWFNKPLSHSSFSKWGAYSGLMLEKDWRSPKRREYDLTFRSALILHYAGG